MFFSLKKVRIFFRVVITLLLFSTGQIFAESKNKGLEPQLAQTNYNPLASKPSQGLPNSVKKILKENSISENNISVYIKDLNSPNVMLEHNADTLRNPASTMKLLTTFAALKELGPNYSWRTEVWLRGSLDNKGVLDGDLVLKGFGDPFLVYENFWKLIKTLRDKGLKEINGDIIIDESYYNLPEYDAAQFDDKPYRVYNAPASALMFNFQATRFLFSPVINNNNNNKKIDITPLPAIEGLSLKNEVGLISGNCQRSHYRPQLSKDSAGVVTIKGTYAAACKQNFILRVVSKPHEHVFNAFKEFWLDLRGSLIGSVKLGKIEKSDELFHVYSSPTLGQQMRLINKWSNNVMTKQLFLTLGARKLSAPATWEKGNAAVLATLEESGIDTQGISIENGSGLSRTSRVSARQMGNMLETAFRDPLMPEFMASLSLPGVDGTLVNRFRKDDIRGRSHLKTGTLNYVTAIAGYMLNRQGKRVVVVIQHNGQKTGAGRGVRIQDALLRWSFEQ